MTGPGRCEWCGTDPLYVAYHDTEWGVPERDGRALWEKLVLDGFQAGLAWITILRKREAFRAAFDGFDPEVIAGWGEAEVTRLLSDPGIVRHRGKIEATIGNAKAYLAIERQDGFADFVWSYVDGVADAERMDGAQGVTCRPRPNCQHATVEGPEKGGLPVLRADHRLCMDAGDGPCERSPHRLPAPRRGRGAGGRGRISREIRNGKLAFSVPFSVRKTRP
jgi:DNA-3-methyladenine glycosylase I